MTQPKIIASSIKYLVNKFSSELIIQDIYFDQLEWQSGQTLSFKELNLVFKFKNVSYKFSSPEVFINYFEGMINKRPIILFIENAKIESANLKVKKLKLVGQIFFTDFKYKLSLFTVSAEELSYKQYEISNFKINLLDNKQLIFIDDASANVYGGQIKTKGWFQYTKSVAYDFESHLTQVNTALLSQANSAFSQLMIITDGDIAVQFTRKEGLKIMADLQAPSGGFMKASLLRFLAQYVPQRQQIEDLATLNKEISLENAQITVTSLSSHKISSNIKFYSSSVNLNMDVKFDINIEGGLEDLIEYLPQ